MDSANTKPVNKQKDSTVISTLSITLSLFRIILSTPTYYNMAFGNGPWTEGRAFGYFTGLLDVPFLFIIFILNIITTYRTFSQKAYKGIIFLNLLIWILWGFLGFLSFMILTFNSASV